MMTMIRIVWLLALLTMRIVPSSARLGTKEPTGGETFSRRNLVTPGKANQCVKEVVRRLGIDEYKLTDPSLLADILMNDMYLFDPQTMELLPRVQEVLGKVLTQKRPLQPMIAQVQNSIKTKHPMIAEFLCQALEQDLIPTVDDPSHKDIIKRTVHHTFLLEHITDRMVKDTEFMVDIYYHLLDMRTALGLPIAFMDFVLALSSATGQVFEAIKIKTMDWVFQQYEEIRERGEIYEEEIDARKNGLKLNILEACIAEKDHGFVDNALAGIATAVNEAETLRVVGEENFIEYELSQDWVSLYESWDLAFITGNVGFLHLLYPKLLIPSVIDAEPAEYMFPRAMSLWASGNWFLFAQLTGREDHNLPNSESLASLWGEVNKRHAEGYVQKTNSVDLDNFAFLLELTYSDLWALLGPVLMDAGIIAREDVDQLAGLLADTH